MVLYHRIYVGPDYVTNLCEGCWEKFTRDHVVILREPDRTKGENGVALYHRACFEDRFTTQVETMSLLRVEGQS